MVKYLPHVDSYEDINDLFKKIKEAAVPARFTEGFLSTILGLNSSSNMTFISLLKKLDFIDLSEMPTSIYWNYRDETKSKAVMAKSIKRAYAKLFAEDKYAYKMIKEDVQSKLIKILGASKEDEIIPKIASTFLELCKLADFERNKSEPMSPLHKRLLAIYFILFVPMILYFLIATWPPSVTEMYTGKIEYFHGLLTISISMETRVLLLIILSGTLGAYIHFGTSFIVFEGEDRLHKVFTFWYLLRPFLGAALALLVYFVFRGLLLNAGTTTNDINLYGMVAIAGLVGMFSKQAIEMLREIFDDLFAKVKNIEEE